ncbi:Ni/Fe hydrogenase subunit alpha [Botryobacter ruber]|uniref:Ni/Fe hydrogenase subunit alpha n=1 Tax=Botryobacter ruber TaxID=2171629 RepID=UPI0013E3F24A|nr:Ni/Fe hydrogenase subunit alpha [Botryobacter ruber]
MDRKIAIDPVTRVEGHGKVTLHLDEQNRVKEARFHIVEFRGFESFVKGHPYWEAPLLVQRLCGICPVSHHLAAGKAIDQIVGIDPEDLPPTATKIRRLLHYAQVFQSHATHFFYLASPDLLFGVEAPAEKRNIMEVAVANPELARKGIQMRKFGQELIQAIAGKKVHGISVTPGGVHKGLSKEERTFFLDGKAIPSVDTMIAWSLEMVRFLFDYREQHREWMDSFAAFPSNHLSLVAADGALELYDGKFRVLDATGAKAMEDAADSTYQQLFSEATETWTYLKFPYLKSLGRENGWYRVGPLARLNVCEFISTPLAERERQAFKQLSSNSPNNKTMHTHLARMIEVLHCAELMKELLLDDSLDQGELVRQGKHRNLGIGVIEAPRGTLIHHYEVDDSGMITRCNLIVSTTHNNEAMNRSVRWVAEQVLDSKPEITEGLLNQVETAVRAYDPCLSCATHALGQMPLRVSLFDAANQLVDEKIRE